MSLFLAVIATAAAAALAGRLSACPTIGALRRRLSAAHRAALTDPLTGLHNRAGLRHAHQAMTGAQAPHPVLVALVDLDAFKPVNDRHGHHAGDLLLTAVAARLAAVAAAHGGIAARLAGDEYALITHAGDPVRLAELIAVLVAEAVDVGAVVVTPTASVGVTVAEPDDPLDTVLRRADVAMYHAKTRGGNTGVAYQPGMSMPDSTPRPVTRVRDRHPGA